MLQIGKLTQSSLLAKVTGLKHGFTNLSLSKEEMSALEGRTATAKQVHKAELIWVETFEKRARDADAVATFTPGLPVGVFSADCTPLLVAAVDSSASKVFAIMAVHAGWRGTAQGITGKSYREFAAATLKQCGGPLRFVAAIGPCIGPQSFEVGPEVVEAFPGSEARGLSRFLRIEDGKRKYLFNLPGENLRQLNEASTETGTALEIDTLDHCTLKLVAQFPSYRRDKEKAGRILSFLEFTE